MSHRLQVLVPPELDAKLGREAQRSRVSKGEWVRQVLIAAVDRPRIGSVGSNAIDRLASLGAPTADINRMLAEIETGCL